MKKLIICLSVLTLSGMTAHALTFKNNTEDKNARIFWWMRGSPKVPKNGTVVAKAEDGGGEWRISSQKKGIHCGGKIKDIDSKTLSLNYNKETKTYSCSVD